MSSKINLTFLTLPVELVYRILDYLDDWSLICSIRNVSTRINRIIDNYHRYRVSYLVPMRKSSPHYVQNAIRFYEMLLTDSIHDYTHIHFLFHQRFHFSTFPCLFHAE